MKASSIASEHEGVEERKMKNAKGQKYFLKQAVTWVWCLAHSLELGLQVCLFSGVQLLTRAVKITYHQWMGEKYDPSFWYTALKMSVKSVEHTVVVQEKWYGMVDFVDTIPQEDNIN